jgi:hypothetical protein
LIKDGLKIKIKIVKRFLPADILLAFNNQLKWSEMVAKLGRWVDKLVRRWVAKLVPVS